MCGIFGLIVSGEDSLDATMLKRACNRLFLHSETRGKEASGLVIRTADRLEVIKEPVPASRLIKTTCYHGLFESLRPRNNGKMRRLLPLAIIGHSRLVTNGRQAIASNNQPVIRDDLVAIHNGIITNVDALWKQFDRMERRHEVDTEVLLALLQYFQDGHDSNGRMIPVFRKIFSLIEGTASLAVLSGNCDSIVLATNCGSLYTAMAEDGHSLFFASEALILQKFAKDLSKIAPKHALPAINQVPPMTGATVSLTDLTLRTFSLLEGDPVPRISYETKHVSLVDRSKRPREARQSLQRCTRCVLPRSMPFIEFDRKGVCNFCRNYRKMKLRPQEELQEMLVPFRRNNGEPDCIFMFSGGRDSCYGLHYVKRELGLNPVAYTYDWGMITDLGRRNQARLCGKLGVEHVLVSADIPSKRRYVRKNVEAWMKRPDLGMIPLFMAGDKQYYYYANQLMKSMDVKLAIVGECPLELSRFKAGFCGVNEGARRIFDVTLMEKARLFAYYMRQYLMNPAYINSSLLDTLFAYVSAYHIKHDYLHLYRYERWNEQKIVDTLIDGYGWETAADTTTTWRIGDGTAAFYNYIYYTVAGFTENDTLRSNQVREGDLMRGEALALVEQENRPRWESMQWYANTIGFDLNEALSVVHAMPKLYLPK